MNFSKICKFMIALKRALETEPHSLVIEDDSVVLVCFERHMRSANNSIPNPYTEEEFLRIFKPLFDLVHVEVISELPLCLEIRNVLSKLIHNGYFTVPEDRGQ